MNSNIIITSPSLDISKNVSGISSLVNVIIKNNNKVEYIHSIAGKEDNETRNFIWFFKQISVVISYILLVVKCKKVNIVHVNMPLSYFSIIRDATYVICARLFGKKVILHFHGGLYNLKTSLPFIHGYLVGWAIALSNQIITLGNDEKIFYQKKYSIRPEKIRVLPNAVKIPTKIPNKFIGGSLNILYLGRIDKNKGLKEIINALKSLPSGIRFHLHIAGDGSDKNEFLMSCKRVLPGKFEYYGVVDSVEKEELLSKSHIFILPSYFEGLPSALLESMAWKIVPIVTNVGSIPEVIENNVNGILVGIGDYKTISSQIAKLHNNMEMMIRLSENAHSTIKEKYDLSNYINSLNSIYHHACN